MEVAFERHCLQQSSEVSQSPASHEGDLGGPLGPATVPLLLHPGVTKCPRAVALKALVHQRPLLSYWFQGQGFKSDTD